MQARPYVCCETGIALSNSSLQVVSSFEGCRLRAAFVIALCLVCGCGPSAMTSRPDGAGGNDSGGVDGSAGNDIQTGPGTGLPDAAQPGDGPVPVCADVPYPTARMCSVPMEICLPTSGYDCCRCLPGHGCGADYVWLCQSSYIDCPPSPPTLGAACTLPSNVDCIYCTSPAVNVGCNGGKWASLAAEVYCSSP